MPWSYKAFCSDFNFKGCLVWSTAAVLRLIRSLFEVHADSVYTDLLWMICNHIYILVQYICMCVYMYWDVCRSSQIFDFNAILCRLMVNNTLLERYSSRRARDPTVTPEKIGKLQEVLDVRFEVPKHSNLLKLRSVVHLPKKRLPQSQRNQQ